MVRFPLLLIPLAIYNIIVWLMPDVSFADPLAKLTLVSGAVWPITPGDVLLALSVVLLLLEVMKGARPGAKYLTDHLLSLIVFGVAAFEFVMWRKFGTATFFLLTLIAMTDFLTGIALRSRHRSMPAMGSGTGPAPVVEERTEATAAAEPRFDRTAASPVAVALGTASAVPAAASVAESVLMDHPEPKIAQPVVNAREPNGDSTNEPTAQAKVEPKIEPKIELKREARIEPKIPSPELQPGNGSQEQ